MNDQESIKTYIQKLLNEHGYTKEVSTSESLIISGLLDSVAVIQIIVFLEEKFGIDFSAVYFDQTNFDSVELITAFVRENTSSSV